MVAEHLTKRRVQNVRCRMVTRHTGAAGRIHARGDRIAHTERALNHLDLMHRQTFFRGLRVHHFQFYAIAEDDTGVADLAAHFSVEGRGL